MASRRGSRKKSRRGRGGLTRGRLVTSLGLLLAAGLGGWMLFGGSSAAQSDADSEAGPAGTTVEPATSAPAANPAVAAVAKGPSAEETAKFVSDARRRIAPLRGAERYTAIRETWEKSAAMLEGNMDVKARQALHGLFHEITDILFFSEYRNEFSIVYVIRKGDTIGGIAKQFGVTEELVCQWNAIEFAKRNNIRENQTLKIVASSPRIVVSKGQYTLSYYFGERLARQYIIAHGTGNGTPVGSATVKSKVVDPDKGPHAGPMQQEMDERWIGLTTIDDNGVPRDGIGLHGTKYEDSIPGETSHGCVRMFNRDVVELYDWVPRGMTVEIRQ